MGKCCECGTELEPKVMTFNKRPYVERAKQEYIIYNKEYVERYRISYDQCRDSNQLLWWVYKLNGMRSVPKGSVQQFIKAAAKDNNIWQWK